MRKLAVGSEEPNVLLRKFKRPYRDTEEPSELAYRVFYSDTFFFFCLKHSAGCF